ncbi:MAG: sigma factor [Candidatus Dormiibacterota bacterium]
MGARREGQDDDLRPRHDDGDSDAIRELMRESMAAGMMSEGEQGTLLRLAADGDRRSQERLVAANLALVIRLAGTRGNQGVSAPDLVQEGSIGLVEAVRSFAESGETDFAAYTEQKVGAQMDAAIEAEAAAVRDAELLVTAATDYERTELLLRRELHRTPTEREIAEKLEWTVDRTRYVAQVVGDALRSHDEELLQFIDPEAIVIDRDEPAEFDT